MLEEFKKYVSLYDLENIDIQSKYTHSLRVMQLNKKYANLLGFDEEDQYIAEVIGLLHDIGCFEQLKVYHSYDDAKTIDHADYSVEQLFNKGIIKKFTDKVEYYPIIEFAIKNHNKKEIPKINDERILKHTQLIRDVDKLDIIYVLGVEDSLKCRANRDKIGDKFMREIKKHVLLDRRDVTNLNEDIIIHYAFVFDIYNAIVLEEYKRYFMAFHEKVNGTRQFAIIYDEIISYIEERIEEYERNRNKI